ncbi:MAG: hypothetical protein QE278_06430 [Limnobacter sp.]|nr:hypothetical protein [Limnobacter sp.]
MQVGKLNTPNAGAQVLRDGQVLNIDQGQGLAWGDVIKNNSATPMEVALPPLAKGQGNGLLVIQPGASARLEALPSDLAGGASRTKVVALGEGIELFEVANDINPAVLEKQEGDEDAVTGLLGAGLFAGGGGALAALAGAVGVGFLLDDDDQDGASPAPENGAGAANGLAGGVENLGDGVNATPLAPLTGVTDPVADVLAMVGGTLAGADEPTGLGDVLGAVVGDPNSAAGGSLEGGLVGLVNAVSTGLDEAFTAPPLDALAPLIDPLSQTLGSNGGVTDGVAQGLANVGFSLTNDASVLEPLTSGLLGPVVGNSGEQNGGVPQTLDQVSEGLTDLTNPDSVLAPLDALTQPVGDVVETLADGVNQLGDALAEPAAQDPSGVLGLVADVLGGDVQPVSSGAGFDNPLAGLTGLLGQ